MDYLSELADDVEARLRSESLTEVEAAAKTVERKLLPKDHEFVRQLDAQKAGFWAKVLEVSGKFFQIDASPMSPKFYAGLFEAVFGVFAKKAETEAMSNATQAFQYIARIESFTKPQAR